MAYAPHSSRLLLLPTFMAVAMVVTPLASLGHNAEEGKRLVCVEVMQACKSSCCSVTPMQQACCDDRSNKLPPQTAHEESDSVPSPCGDQGDCSCCVTINFSVVLGLILRSDRTVADTARHHVPTVADTPDCPGWHHRLLRPPIC